MEDRSFRTLRQEKGKIDTRLRKKSNPAIAGLRLIPQDSQAPDSGMSHHEFIKDMFHIAETNLNP